MQRQAGPMTSLSILVHWVRTRMPSLTHLAGTGLPATEVHIFNVQAREEWCRRSVISPVVVGYLGGLGWHGYILALQGLLAVIEERIGPAFDRVKTAAPAIQITPLSRNLSRSPRDI